MDSRTLATIFGAFICGGIIGGLVATCLWFRWYLSGETVKPIVTYSGKEWGE